MGRPYTSEVARLRFLRGPPTPRTFPVTRLLHQRRTSPSLQGRGRRALVVGGRTCRWPVGTLLPATCAWSARGCWSSPDLRSDAWARVPLPAPESAGRGRAGGLGESAALGQGALGRPAGRAQRLDENPNPTFPDQVYLIVQQSVQPTTYKAVLLWRDAYTLEAPNIQKRMRR